MKGQVLGASDRAALQSLVPLAGALGAGTIFALFFGGRRHRTGLAVFEVFAIVSVLGAVGTTAYLSIALLHANQPISDHDLTQTAMPLVVAVFVLVLVSAGARLPSPLGRAFAILPIVVVAGVISALLASSAWEASPARASLFALVLLGFGALFALLAAGAERLNLGWDRRTSQRWVVGIVNAGYIPERRTLALATPEPEDQTDDPKPVACWNRRGRLYVDTATLRRMRDRTKQDWNDLESGAAVPPSPGAMLVEIRVGLWIPGLRPRRRATIGTLERGRQRSRVLEANEDGLFDVTGARLLGSAVPQSMI